MGRRTDPVVRFRRHYVVDEETGCWIWTASLGGNGYPQFNVDGKIVRPYKWYWELLNGPVPYGLELDHIVCDYPPCVNPDHLKPVTHAENLGKGWQKGDGYHSRYRQERYGIKPKRYNDKQ